RMITAPSGCRPRHAQRPAATPTTTVPNGCHRGPAVFPAGTRMITAPNACPACCRFLSPRNIPAGLPARFADRGGSRAARGSRLRVLDHPSLRTQLYATISGMTEVTRVLDQIQQGDPYAADQLLPLVYEELRK